MGMGSGASTARDTPSTRPVPVVKDPSVTVDTADGGMQWLLSVVDKEKHEKEWLAGKYDEKCAEVRALQQEITALRAELGQRSHATDERRTTPPVRGMAPDVMGKVAGDTADARTPASASGSSAEPAITSPGNRLKERRGLKLSIETPSRTRLKTDVSVISPLPEEVAHLRHSREPGVPAAGPAATTADDLPVEPMSALLRRRSEDWGPLPGAASGSAGGLAQNGPMRVRAEKVFNMQEDDCPASPKRILRAREKSY
mmetsp:Transcript_26759/g.84954  ORF Transcript_26759/g.84954 Transcript_26759/m.84954 type:complete len:257 (-) Transcript_26759:152-922(-)